MRFVCCFVEDLEDDPPEAAVWASGMSVALRFLRCWVAENVEEIGKTSSMFMLYILSQVSTCRFCDIENIHISPVCLERL